MKRTVKMRRERDTFIIDDSELPVLARNVLIIDRNTFFEWCFLFCKFRNSLAKCRAERENLEAARVSDGRALPAHEFRESSGSLYDFLTRLKIEMIRICEYDFSPERFQLIGQNAFHVGLRTDRSEGRSMDDTMGRGKNTRTSTSGARALFYLESNCTHMPTVPEVSE